MHVHCHPVFRALKLISQRHRAVPVEPPLAPCPAHLPGHHLVSVLLRVESQRPPPPTPVNRRHHASLLLPLKLSGWLAAWCGPGKGREKWPPLESLSLPLHLELYLLQGVFPRVPIPSEHPRTSLRMAAMAHVLRQLPQP